MKPAPLYLTLLASVMLITPAVAKEAPAGWRWYNEPKTAPPPHRQSQRHRLKTRRPPS